MSQWRKDLTPSDSSPCFKFQRLFFSTKRPVNKLVQPGKWDTSVGGHISFGEDLETALHREAFEEIGLKDFTAKFIGKYL